MWDSIEVDGMSINGPIVYATSNGVIVQQYFGFTSDEDAAEKWTGPKDCSNKDGESKFTCTGKFLGWGERESEFDGSIEVMEVWMITRVKVATII